MYNNPFMNSPAGDYYRNQMQQIAQPQFAPTFPQTPRYSINHVTSIDEARNQMVDPLVTSLFMDAGAGKIYLKRMNNQGKADFLTFSLDEPVTEAKQNPLEEINMRLKAIEQKIGGTHAKSNADISGYDESGAGYAGADVSADGTAESSAD